MITIEAAVETLPAALAAERAGVNRLELCLNLDVGGLTPPGDLIDAVRAHVSIPMVVLIRPRPGSFVYSGDEFDGMRYQTSVIARSGVAGIVTGVLTRDNHIDVERTRGLVEAAGGLPVTFHHAFDEATDLREALERLVEAGVSRVLTSGGAATALEGADTIAALTAQAAGRIVVMAGGRIRDHNVRDVLTRTRAAELHARLVDEESMRRLVTRA
jgi:copper homeostasis protein